MKKAVSFIRDIFLIVGMISGGVAYTTLSEEVKVVAGNVNTLVITGQKAAEKVIGVVDDGKTIIKGAAGEAKEVKQLLVDAGGCETNGLADKLLEGF